jgi:hypothetical protein
MKLLTMAKTGWNMCIHKKLVTSEETYFLLANYEGPQLCSFLQPPVTSPLFGPNILLSTLFSGILSLCCCPNFWYQVSHPYRTTKLLHCIEICRSVMFRSWWQRQSTSSSESFHDNSYNNKQRGPASIVTKLKVGQPKNQSSILCSGFTESKSALGSTQLT